MVVYQESPFLDGIQARQMALMQGGVWLHNPQERQFKKVKSLLIHMILSRVCAVEKGARSSSIQANASVRACLEQRRLSRTDVTCVLTDVPRRCTAYRETI
jgi:hypothetical protein